MPKRLEGLETRLLDAAVRLLGERGLPGMTVRNVALAADVSYGGPVARFGDERGLLAAVAERGFRLLEQGLAAAPSSATPRTFTTLRPSAVNTLGLRYVEFALTHRHLHRAMHHSDLWTHTPVRKPASPSIARRDAKSAGWLARAAAARDACFARFVAAAVADQMAGRVADGSPGEIARVVTALSDGFILQTSDAAAGAPAGLERQLAVAERIFGWAQAGLEPKDRGSGRRE
ncbi:MAG: TetR/AcrR family transcriptional regulator [Gemmatimonadales bacterium]